MNLCDWTNLYTNTAIRIDTTVINIKNWHISSVIDNTEHLAVPLFVARQVPSELWYCCFGSKNTTQHVQVLF